MSSLRAWLQRRRSSLHERGLHRSLRIADGDGLLHFSDNDYLGLADDPRMVEAGIDALRRHGSGSRASRLISGHRSVHADLEAELADFLGFEAALVFSSGWAANAGALAAVATSADLVLQDEWNHASLLDGAKLTGARSLRFAHGDASALLAELRRCDDARHRIIVTDGVFSMDGDIADLSVLSATCTAHDAWLYVDDAHGLGVLGENGRGTAEHFDVERGVDIHVGTLSKTLASQGGFVAGSRELIDNLVQRARAFVYSTGLSPASAACARAALRVLREEPERRLRLREHSARFRNGLRTLGVKVSDDPTPIVPIISGDTERAVELSQLLEREGFRVPAVRPPTVPHGKSRLRVTLSARHETRDVDRLLEALSRCLSQEAVS